MTKCNPCLCTLTLPTCFETLVVGVVGAINTAYYVYIKDITTGKTVRYATTSNGAGLISITISSIFAENHSYELWATLATGTQDEVEDILISGANQNHTCFELKFETINLYDNSMAEFPSVTLKKDSCCDETHNENECLCVTQEMLDALGRPYDVYTALLNQEFKSEGLLIIGVEYTLKSFNIGDDFTNVGGANVTGTVFVATGTTPTDWTNGSQLTNNLPPSVTVLENTIGNIVWTRFTNGIYIATLVNAFPQLKTWHIVSHTDIYTYFTVWNDVNTIYLETTIPTDTGMVGTPVQNPVADGLLVYTPIEIRVYH